MVSFVFQLKAICFHFYISAFSKSINCRMLDFVNTSTFNEWLDRFLVPVDDPGSRLFHVNILMSFVFILVWIFITQKNSRASVYTLSKKFQKLVFRKKYWWNTSTKIDYQIYFLNSLFKIFLFIPFLDFSFKISKLTILFLLKANQHQPVSLSASYFNLLLFSVFAFVFDDFLRFFHHFLMHKIPILWKLHKTHHSAKF